MRFPSVRWQNFRSFVDSGWREIRPLTIIIGANNTGKTSFYAPLLLLRQTLDSLNPETALLNRGNLFDGGRPGDLLAHAADTPTLTFRIRGLPELDPGLPTFDDDTETQEPFDLSLSFELVDSGFRLKTYRVADSNNAVMVKRTRRESGSYSVTGMDFSPEGRATKRFTSGAQNLRKLLNRDRPNHFTFSQWHHPLVPELTEFDQGLDLLFRFFRFESINQYTHFSLLELLNRVSYLGPLRAEPRHWYELSAESPLVVGKGGEKAPEIVFRHKEDMQAGVEGWMRHFELGNHIDWQTGPETFSLCLRRLRTSPAINFADSGFGASQLLPLVVQGLHADPNDLIIAEQPEIHLNPRAQSRLADLFAHFAKDKFVLVETHSEHLLLRVRRLIAEGTLSADSVALYFTSKDGDQSKIEQVRIQEDGHINHTDWPEGFFDETLRQGMGLAKAQAERSSFVK